MSSAVSNHLAIPWDVWTHTGFLVSFSVVHLVFSTRRDLYKTYRAYIQDVVIPYEQTRMGFTRLPSLRGRLTLDFLANFWWQLTSEERRVIRTNLAVDRLQYYESLQPATVVLEEEVSQASDDPQALFDLAGIHTEERALILSNRFLYLSAFNNHQDLIEHAQDANNAFYAPLPTFSNLMIEAISGIIGWSPHFEEALRALLRLRMGFRRQEISLPEALEVIDRFVRVPRVREGLLDRLVLEEVEPGRRLGTSIAIALKMNDRKKRIHTLRNLIFQAITKKVPVDEILKAIRAISEDHREDRDACILSLLRISPALDPSASTAMASMISDTNKKNEALKLIAKRKESAVKQS
jgi:uncharacterized protein YeeX (DUF496 family)